MGVGTAELKRLWDGLVASRAGDASRRGWLRLVKGERPAAPPPEPVMAAREAGLVVPPRPLSRANILGPARHRGFPLPQFVTLVHGLRTVFSDAGSGPAVVFVHGPGGNLTHWLHVAPRLVDSCRVLGLDLPACGESERPRRPLSVGFCADHVCGLLDELHIDRAAIVGHSLGATVAAELARHRPDRVTRLVLLSPTGLPRPPLWLRAAGRALLHPAILGALLPPRWRTVLDLAFAERNEYTCGFTACIEQTCRPEDLSDIAAAIAGLRDGFLDGISQEPSTTSPCPRCSPGARATRSCRGRPCASPRHAARTSWRTRSAAADGCR